MEIPISVETEERIKRMFDPNEYDCVRSKLLKKCGSNIFDKTHTELAQRVRFGVLKLSEGNKEKFLEALKLANIDWRDVLVGSGFAEDIKVHKQWWPETK